MLQIDLSRLRPGRETTVQATIAPDAEIWNGSELRFSSAVEVAGAVALAAGGEVVVRGTWKAPVEYDCGRCLEVVPVSFEGPLNLVFAPGGEWEASDADVRTIGRHDTMLDLEEAIREEVVLEIPRYFIPAATNGRCDRCGHAAERFGRVPERPMDQPDPRWSALKALQTD
ncbi:MAG: DUF177 domain-containing protein [Gemmatimonadetes bacterium]|nr:DUF177 domain-containing protein [Gemmatimonadota bacterium]MYE92112.1 DUF177 domain-containing protein [Gemmatimonadota bacterium]MYJ11375.1 DUF177 domain-containing protein [Gemmatimonadota bacterium]